MTTLPVPLRSIIVIFLLFSLGGYAQVLYPPGYINMNIKSGGLVIPVDYRSKEGSQRDQYVSPQWNQGTIMLLTGDSIHGYPLKYNLTTGEVEVKTQQAIKVVPLREVKRFSWLEDGRPTRFINSGGYTIEGVPLVGYLQLLSEGSLNLFKRTFLSVQRANYKPELDVGSPEDKLIREDVYYVAKGSDIIKVKGKKIYNFMEGHRASVKQHAKQNGLYPKEEQDLIKIVDYYNQLAP